MNKAISAIVLTTAAVTGCTTESAINAEALFEARCNSCHSSEMVKNVRKTRAQWEECLERMILKGARLTTEEKKTLVRYLAKHNSL